MYSRGGISENDDDFMQVYQGIYGGHNTGPRGDECWKDLPVRTLQQKDIQILAKSEDKKACPICQSDFKVGDEVRILPCFHEFHKDCCDQWFVQQNDNGKDASCPLDRKKIKDIAHQHVH